MLNRFAENPKNMDDKRVIVFFYSSRSEIGLINPVIEALEAKGFEIVKVNLTDHVDLKVESLGEVYNWSYLFLKNMMAKRPDMCFTPFDRYEMVFATLASHHLNIPIAQMHAGDISEGTWDDATRHVISLYSTIYFCNGKKSTERVKRLLKSIDKSTTHVYDVGSTAFDNIELDNSIVPTFPYNLVVYNIPTKNPELISEELNFIEKLLMDTGSRSIWILPSDKVFTELVISTVDRLEHQGKVVRYSSLPRSQFLALMKNCRYFIGNSSSMIYEAPAFLKSEQIIHVGIRNEGREPVEIKTRGSERIAEIIDRYFKEHSFK